MPWDLCKQSCGFFVV